MPEFLCKCGKVITITEEECKRRVAISGIGEYSPICRECEEKTRQEQLAERARKEELNRRMQELPVLKGIDSIDKLIDLDWDNRDDALEYLRSLTKTIFFVKFEEHTQYEESIYILFSLWGKLYEVISSHCSCSGFDFHPEVTSIEAIKLRPETKEDKELLEVLDLLSQAGFK